jgi:hypothetical protein
LPTRTTDRAVRLSLGRAVDEAVLIPPRSETLLRLDGVKAVLAAYGISDISSLGKLSISGDVVPQPGLLRPSPVAAASSYTIFQAAFSSLAARGQKRSLVLTGGNAVLLPSEPLPLAQPTLPCRTGPARVPRSAFGGGPVVFEPARIGPETARPWPGPGPFLPGPGDGAPPPPPPPPQPGPQPGPLRRHRRRRRQPSS